MSRAYASLLALVSLSITAGCVVDSKLGDPDQTTTDASTGPTSTGSEGGTTGTNSSVSASSGIPTDSTDTLGTTTDAPPDSTAESTAGTGSGMCADWSAPPFDCELPGDAHASVTGFASAMSAELCDVTGVVTDAGAPNVDTVTLDCPGQTLELEFFSAAPHHDMHFLDGQQVEVTVAEPKFNIDEATPSFAIYSTDGESPVLLVAWVNSYDVDADIDIDITPFTVAIGPSGCPATDAAETCDADGAIMMQRAILTFGDDPDTIALQDGAHGTTTTVDGYDYDVTVEIAESRVCWDEDCVIDDSGPFERYTFLATIAPTI